MGYHLSNTCANTLAYILQVMSVDVKKLSGGGQEMMKSFIAALKEKKDIILVSSVWLCINKTLLSIKLQNPYRYKRQNCEVPEQFLSSTARSRRNCVARQIDAMKTRSDSILRWANYMYICILLHAATVWLKLLPYFSTTWCVIILNMFLF